MSRSRCTGTTQSGEPCNGFADAPPSPYCIAHDESRREQFLRLQGERSAKGHELRAEQRQMPPRSSCNLRSMDDLLGGCEWWLAAVEHSNGEVTSKANAAIKIIALARDILETSELEKENADLRQILLEKHPELRKHLKAVK